MSRIVQTDIRMGLLLGEERRKVKIRWLGYMIDHQDKLLVLVDCQQ